MTWAPSVGPIAMIRSGSRVSQIEFYRVPDLVPLARYLARYVDPGMVAEHVSGLRYPLFAPSSLNRPKGSRVLPAQAPDRRSRSRGNRW
jgi:hypothetical protein